MTLEDAAREWVNGFNAIPQGMIEQLMRDNPDEWQEVTAPAVGDRVYVYDTKPAGSKEHGGEIIVKNRETGGFTIRLDDGAEIIADDTGFSVEYCESLPMWGTMWSFGDVCDNWWLDTGEGISIMSNCGFRIYEHDYWGYFFGIDGAGYSFMEAHFLPLYKARGLQWHDTDDQENF